MPPQPDEKEGKSKAVCGKRWGGDSGGQGGPYFHAAGIVVVAWGAYAALLNFLGQMALVTSDSLVIPIALAVVVGALALRYFLNSSLRLLHLSPFAVIGILLAFLAVFSG
ncbi:MAG: hypothetical protein ACPGNT_06270 [Rhodospirillales bacterium]